MMITLQGGPRDGTVIDVPDDSAIVRLHIDSTCEPHHPTWRYDLDRKTGTATYVDD